MTTVPPPPSKRQKREALERTQLQADLEPPVIEVGSLKARFIDTDSKQLAEVVEIPVAEASEKNVSLLLNTLLGRDREDFTPYRFRIHIPGSETIIDTFPSSSEFLAVLRGHGIANPFETTITLSAEPQAVFKVQAVTRMSAKIPGHGEAILCCQFSPKSSSRLCTGSGDCTARIFDTDTGTPKWTLSGHTGWVLAVSWSPDGSRLATGSMDKTLRIWNPETGKPIGKAFSGHSKWVNSVAWEPYHLWKDSPRLASASKDASIRVWIVNTGITEHVLSGHKGNVSCVRWGGKGFIYSSSHDKTIKVWDASNGTLKHTLSAHAHWINHIALSTDFALRTAFYDHTKVIPVTDEERTAKAKERFEKAATKQGKIVERIVSASDDFTMYLWDPAEGTKPVARLLGHQKMVNHVTFSPDGTLIASSGFDNHTKLWSARDGKFIHTLRGHVAAVYQCCFSADSRLLVTSSKDTTLKVWNVQAGKLAIDLPGHQDEVYAVDWSPDGQRVGSGGKDKALRVWRN